MSREQQSKSKSISLTSLSPQRIVVVPMKTVGFTIRLYNSLGAAMNLRMGDRAVISSFSLFAAVSLASAQCPTSSTSPIGKALRTLSYGKVQTKAPIASDHEVTRSTVNYISTEFYEDGTAKYAYLRWNNRRASLDFTKPYLVKDDAKLMPPGTTISLGGARYCPDRIVLQYYPPDNNYGNGMDSGTISLMLASGYETWPVERILTFLHKLISIPETAPPPALPPPAGPLQPAAPLHLPSSYVSSKTPADELQLNADHSFSLQEAGQTYRGTFVANGNTLELNINGGPKSTATIQGNSLTDSGGQTWVLREQPAAGAAPEAPPAAAAPAVAPLRLPSTYVSAQTPADQIQLNADNSFSLQEGGQTYRGTFVANGNNLELNISGGSKNTAKIQGNSLTDSGGQTWILGTPSPGSTSTGTLPPNREIGPVAASTPTAAGSFRGPAGPESDIEAGKEVNFKIKYNQIGPGDRQTTYISYSPEAYVAMAYMRDGVLTLSKTAFAFSGDCRINRGFGRVEHCDFRVSPGKILELENQPEQSSRIHVRVAIKNAKGDKEDKKDYYFYHASASAIDGTANGRPSVSIICDGCDDSMDVLYGLLTKIRAQ